MAQYTIEIVTILAAVVIGVIMAIYLTILKRKGWLDRSEHFYLCSNRECKKVFQRPVELKDLSENPARVYRACPHCGTNLEQSLASCGEKKPQLDAKLPFRHKKTDMKIEDSASILADNLNTSKNSTEKNYLHTNQDIKDSIEKETRKPESNEQAKSLTNNSQRTLEKPVDEKIEAEMSKMLEEIRASQAKKTDAPLTKEHPLEAMNVSSSSDCPYGYGYLSQRDKDEGIPSTCVECPKSLDCMLAEYYKKRESVKEIKKWYHF